MFLIFGCVNSLCVSLKVEKQHGPLIQILTMIGATKDKAQEMLDH